MTVLHDVLLGRPWIPSHPPSPDQRSHTELSRPARTRRSLSRASLMGPPVCHERGTAQCHEADQRREKEARRAAYGQTAPSWKMRSSNALLRTSPGKMSSPSRAPACRLSLTAKAAGNHWSQRSEGFPSSGKRLRYSTTANYPGQDPPQGASLRLRAGRCEMCQTHADVEVHHVRRLADLRNPGLPQQPEWARLMARKRRKILIVCATCHSQIHNKRQSDGEVT